MSGFYPKVSVLIPHYNMHAMLPYAVQRVEDQDYENIELIIIDDGSDQKIDDTLLSDFAIDTKLLEIDHGGKPQAINRGFAQALGEYITILDADDRLPPKSISQRLSILQENGAELCIGSFEVYHEGHLRSVRSIGPYIHKSKKKVIRDLSTNIISPLHQNTMMFSRELLKQVGCMDEQMIRGQDKDFAIRLINSSTAVACLEASVYVYNRYNCLFDKRMIHRITGTKYKLLVINRYFRGLQKWFYLVWEICIGTVKLIHDIFGIYKK